MGLGRGGLRLSKALFASSWCDLVAVASRHANRIEQFTASHPGIAAYTDFRSLIVENDLDALFVAIPPFLRVHYLALAAERELPVWMLTPAARRFDEALAITEQFEGVECPIVVARSWGVEPGLQADALELDKLGRLFFARGSAMTCWEEDFDWRGDSMRAGGGVLLDRAYGLIDTLVQIMGLPTTVYAAAKGVSRPGGTFPYDTEDTAAVVCQFSNGSVAEIAACWTSGPREWSLEFHGTGGSLHLDESRAVVRDRPGTAELLEQSRAENGFAPLIEEFLSSLRSNPSRMRSTLRQHLPTMAVIQAAYLSARTGQPESPGTIYHMHDVKGPRPSGNGVEREA